MGIIKFNLSEYVGRWVGTCLSRRKAATQSKRGTHFARKAFVWINSSNSYLWTFVPFGMSLLNCNLKTTLNLRAQSVVIGFAFVAVVVLVLGRGK